MRFPTELVHYISSLSPYAQVGLGTASGWLTGFFIMKCCKFVSAIIGGAIIIANIAEIEGLVNIDWWNVKNNVQNISAMPMQKFALAKTNEMPSNMYNFVISFGGGSLMGVGCC